VTRSAEAGNDAPLSQAQALAAGLRPPRPQAGLIERPALVERLRDGRASALTLVCAPAGYGKTTLLAQWEAADRDRTPFVWIPLDARDSDPVRLWGHVITGIAGVHAEAGARSLPALAAGPGTIALSSVPLLIDELAPAPDLVLVLDDWQEVRNPLCDETMTAFVEHAPASVQVVVSSRSDPGLPIARLRAHGELSEIRARDLRLSSSEAADLIRAQNLELDPDDVERLSARTEGWLAGLCLALLAVKEHGDPDRFVAEFSGDTKHIFDYLSTDVLAGIEPDVRDFLLRSSVLERLSGPVCDAVLERTGSASTLAEVERSNLFLLALDEAGTEYRYHPLFATALRRTLEATDPDAVPALHARASAWYERQGDLERAIDHAIASKDRSRASDLVLVAGIPLLSVGRTTTVKRWLDALSWPEAHADRQLALVRALAAGLGGGGRDEIERWLAVAESGPDFGPLPNGITSVSSCVAMVSAIYLSRGIEDAIRSARLVLETEPDQSPFRYAGLVPLGQALYLADRSDEARAPLEDARALAGAGGHISTAVGISYASLIELADGETERAEQLAWDALGLAERLGHGAGSGAANPHLALGCALMQGTDLHGAVAHLTRAVELAGLEAPSYWHAHALLRLAEARHRVGDAHGARRALESARTDLGRLPDSGMLGGLLLETEELLRHRARRDGFLGEELSEAELRALRALARGQSVSEVAHELWLSTNTVKTHRRSIYRKLGASNREEMVERATETGVLGIMQAARDVHPGD
jgi:LuxR family maltose regulon positive regulatory protein